MKIIEYIDKKATWKRVIISLVSSVVLGTCIATMFFGFLKLKPEATMDSLNFYNSDTFFYNLEIQGKEGRQAYFLLHLFDYIFITQFYFFFVYLIYLIIHKLRQKIWTKYLCLIPVVSAIMDFFENICIDLSIFLFPNKIIFIGNLSGIFTLTKMISINVTLLVVFVLSCILITKTIKNKLSINKT